MALVSTYDAVFNGSSHGRWGDEKHMENAHDLGMGMQLKVVLCWTKQSSLHLLMDGWIPLFLCGQPQASADPSPTG